MTDSERLDKLQRMVDDRFGLSKLVSRDGNRSDVRSIIDDADPELDSFRSPTESARIARFSFDETTGLDAEIRYPGIMLLIAEVAQMFRDTGAVNVLQFHATPPDMETLLIQIQRVGGKTPMELRSETLAELEVERNRRIVLEEQLASLKSQI